MMGSQEPAFHYLHTPRVIHIYSHVDYSTHHTHLHTPRVIHIYSHVDYSTHHTHLHTPRVIHIYSHMDYSTHHTHLHTLSRTHLHTLQLQYTPYTSTHALSNTHLLTRGLQYTLYTSTYTRFGYMCNATPVMHHTRTCIHTNCAHHTHVQCTPYTSNSPTVQIILERKFFFVVSIQDIKYQAKNGVVLERLHVYYFAL